MSRHQGNLVSSFWCYNVSMAKYESFTQEAKNKVDTFLFNIVDAVSKNTERVVKKGFLDFPKPPIKTGNLRRSITGKVITKGENNIEGEVRASTTTLIDSQGGQKGGKIVEYAKFIEYGTSKMQPRPFMRNGIAKAEASNDQIIIKLSKQ